MHVWLFLVSRILTGVTAWFGFVVMISSEAVALPVAWDLDREPEPSGWLSKRSENFEIFYQPELAAMAPKRIVPV